ncbi:MAG: hypothetical protein CM15mP70_10370 [Pelagibacteraceae bacterium]|nr:MAG: hypothetical protein CM15mP70_10370 [Pelagibacteraceae bacterium]
MSIGVSPNLDSKILDNTKIILDKNGFYRNKRNYGKKTNNLFFHLGIIGGPWLAHKAMHDAINCVEYISGKNTHKNPKPTFSQDVFIAYLR